ncbi:hypothetical protein [Butyrivibrio sp. MC2021]|uniref:hypothetical protein n=1 Tax=Butyrivibrio sp. MC2021 TaxID=1408306 RepID=UPI00047B1CEF|nr:hypothetical protein [Butyrivibrio sp. MC2021]
MRKKIIIVCGIVLAIFMLVYISQVVKNRGGLNVKCEVDYPVPEIMVHYRQDDDRWRKLHLGDSKYTMESSGCITTCIASAISGSSNPLSPGGLVTYLSENGVFDAAGNMQWGAIDQLPGFNAEVYSGLDAGYIDECLSKGRYPIVKIHRKSLFSYHHFVLIIGAENGEYICMDPLKDTYTTLKEYSNRIYSVRCVWYEL